MFSTFVAILKKLLYLCKLKGFWGFTLNFPPVNRKMKDRIKQIMESQHMTQQTFANFIGMSAASLSSIFNERTKPTLKTVEAIQTKLPSINLEWLMFGKGPMYNDQLSQEDVPLPSDQSRLPSEQTINFDNPVVVTGEPLRGNAPLPASHIPSNTQKNNLNYFDKMKRQITEIRVFYDDQTWESFVPKK